MHIQPNFHTQAAAKVVRYPPLLPPPKIHGDVVEMVSTSLVRNHRAYLRLCSFINACMKAASLQLCVSLPETSLWRERVRAPQPQLDLDGLLCGTRCVAASDNLCSEPPSSSLQHLSNITYSSLRSP